MKRLFPIIFSLLFIVLFSSLSKAQVDLQNGLMGYYPFSSNSGDSSGNSNHGTVNGAVLTQDRFGMDNNAYSFDGINDYISLPAADFLNLNYSFSLWAKPAMLPASASTAALLSIGGTAGDQQIALTNNYNSWKGWAVIGYNVGVTVQSPNVTPLPEVNTWYHIVGVRDNAKLYLYVNGVLFYEVTSGGDAYYSSTQAIVGARYSLTQFFKGAIDDVRIYNRAINLDEVLSLYTENLSTSKDGSNLITGKIFNDLNKNCTQQIGELGLQGRIVKAEPGPAYGFTDENGVYKIFVNPGTYEVSPVSPSWWRSSCSDSVNTVSFVNDSSVSFNNDFGSEVIPHQVLTVDIATARLRRCFRNTYNVSYCNEGTATASNVEVKVDFPPAIIPLSSSIPWTKNGNTYTFTIGTLNIGDCAAFSITDSVSCDVALGSTHCVKASISSPSLPVDNGSVGWDKSSVKVEGSCMLDSIAQFTITNTGEPGNGDMDAPSEFRVYADNELVLTGQFQLAGGQTQTIKIDASGQTIRLEADQRPGHPGKSRPRSAVEDCGEGDGGVISFGFITQVPEDDEDVFVEEDCQVVIGSFDPNDKNVKPLGLTSNHYINDDQELEYLIRFQNTGTDTAFTVIIRDTLSAALDVTTLKSGASSHAYKLNISGNGHAVLEWIFPNILLPDKNVNEPGSNGYIKFKIRQSSGNPKGTVIENRAGIIFDYNEPVITNFTHNIVYDTIIEGTPMQPLSVKAGRSTKNVLIKVQPNPFTESTHISIESGQPFGDLSLEIYDVSGRRLQSIESSTADFYIYKKDLTKGLYFYKITSSGEWLGTGKLLIE